MRASNAGRACARIVRSLDLALLLAALATLAGCGPDVRHERAQRTLRLAADALARTDPTSGDERPATAEHDDEAGGATPGAPSEALLRAHRDAMRWLERSEAAIDHWPSAGAAPLATMMPCLARSLGRLRERLAREGAYIPDSLRDAEAHARTAVEARCRLRRRRAPPPESE